MKSRGALALVVVGAIASVVSLLLPWFRHDRSLGGIRTRITLTPVAEEHCSNFARRAFECRSRTLFTDDTWKLLYGSFVHWSTITAVAAVLTAIAALAMVAIGTRDDATGRITRRATWTVASTLAIGTLVTMGRMPRDPRTEALEILAGGLVALAASICVLAGVALLVRRLGHKIKANAWLVPLGALLVVASALYPSWRERTGDVGSREIGLATERFCGTHRIGCSYRSFEPVVDSEGSPSRNDARRLGLRAAHLGPTAALLALFALGCALEDRARSVTSTFAWIAAVATLAYAALGGMFLFHAGYPRDHTPAIGAVLAVIGIVFTIGAVAMLARED